MTTITYLGASLDRYIHGFYRGVATSQGKQAIFVVVDRLSKYAHFMPLSHPYTALDIAQAFMDNIYKLHGLAKSNRK